MDTGITGEARSAVWPKWTHMLRAAPNAGADPQLAPLYEMAYVISDDLFIEVGVPDLPRLLGLTTDA